MLANIGLISVRRCHSPFEGALLWRMPLQAVSICLTRQILHSGVYSYVATVLSDALYQFDNKQSCCKTRLTLLLLGHSRVVHGLG